MVEIILLTLLAGAAFSTAKPMRAGNPFQIYFLIWFLVVIGYYFGTETYIPISNKFLFLIWLVSLIALAFSIFSRPRARLIYVCSNDGFFPRRRLLFLAQISVILAIPFVYEKANELSGGSVFTVVGYTRLRSAMTDEGRGFGVWSYFSVLAYVVSSIKFYDFLRDRRGKWGAIIALLVGLFYAYIGTGRTFFLLFAVLMVFPAVIRRMIDLRGALVSVSALALMFLLVATLTGKGVSVDADVGSNAASLLENLRGYTVAPLLAFHNLMESNPPAMWGQNTFRFFIAVLSSIGVLGIEPVALIREYQFVPDPTNVYTVYEAYFRDFYYIGMFIPPVFLIGHWGLYRRAMRLGGVWLFYYSASVYPLVMQFFQDQYFSLLSMWLQVVFWFWVFIGSGRLVLAERYRLLAEKG